MSAKKPQIPLERPGDLFKDMNIYVLSQVLFKKLYIVSNTMLYIGGNITFFEKNKGSKESYFHIIICAYPVKIPMAY